MYQVQHVGIALGPFVLGPLLFFVLFCRENRVGCNFYIYYVPHLFSGPENASKTTKHNQCTLP